MVLRTLQLVAVAAVLVGVFGFLSTGTASAQELSPYNYYVPPTPNCLGSSLYPCPRPVPPLVGHTYITYPPLNPHEFLYKHSRVYYTSHPGSVTRTYVTWH